MPVARTIGAHVEQFVRAPIQRVYAAYVDPVLMTKFMGIKAITKATGPLDRTGTMFTEVVYPFHRPRTEVLAAEPPVLHDMGGSVVGIRWRWTSRFAAKDDGTVITLDAEVKFPGGPINWLLRRTQEVRRMEQRTRERLATFAALVEGAEN
jgi:uncharacterized protein YndB with AHSA1/START domain